MIKFITVPREQKAEVVSWLQENIGPESVRWWLQDNIIFRGEPGPSTLFSIDVTEEEGPMLTVFMLRWA